LGVVGPPLHEQIDAAVFDQPKPEPLVEPQRGIAALDRKCAAAYPQRPPVIEAPRGSLAVADARCEADASTAARVFRRTMTTIP
jgi:hypothetical protein